MPRFSSDACDTSSDKYVAGTIYDHWHTHGYYSSHSITGAEGSNADLMRSVVCAPPKLFHESLISIGCCFCSNYFYVLTLKNVLN